MEGTNTIHISGTANVPKLVEDLKTIAQKAGSAVGNVNTDQLNQLNDVIQSGDIDVNSGVDDKLLRRFQVSVDLKPPAGHPGAPDSLTLDMQLNFADVNKPQTIQAPANAQPLKDLFRQHRDQPGPARQRAPRRPRDERSPARRPVARPRLRALGHSGLRAVPLAGLGTGGAAAMRQPARPVAA